MGREIRKVPANWQHPKKERYNAFLNVHETVYRPMFDETFEHAATEWKNAFMDWESGRKRKYPNEDGSLMEYWEWNGNPPDPEYYRPYKDEEGTWFQVYETVSEGTPVTPPFATLEELERHLYTHGCEWDDKPWTRENAEAFCRQGHTPSLVISGGEVLMSKDIPAFFEKHDREST